MVGRNLMRHYVDLYALRLGAGRAMAPNLKELAFNDYYRTADGVFGTVQSFGALPPAPVIVADLRKETADGPWPWLAPLMAIGKPLLNQMLHGMLDGRLIMGAIMEDLPFADNHVRLGEDSSMVLRYAIRNPERLRIKAFRRELAGLFAPLRPLVLKQAENNARIAHACGTCRMGTDPKDSVINADGRAHGVDNLYIADASFFPSSGGINPGLTIAAFALRVAERIAQSQPGSAHSRLTVVHAAA